MSEIEYFYSAHSYYAYVGSAHFMAIAQAAGRRILHKPVILSPVIEAAGSQPFAERSKTHVDYYFGRELERWAEEREVPVIAYRPTHHDADMTLPTAALIACQRAGLDCDRLAHAMLSAHWAEDANIADPETLAGIARGVGIDPDPLLAAAGQPEALAQVQANTEEAKSRGVLGSPTYVVDGDPFYGQDRLDMVERALRKPYSAVRFGR